METTKKQRYEKRFFLSLFIVVLVLFAGVIIYNNEKSNDKAITEKETSEPIQTQQQAQAPVEESQDSAQTVQAADQLSVVSGIVYRHLVAYNLVCTEAGRPLVKYPEYFSRQFTPEIQKINTAWVHRGKSLEQVLTDYDSTNYPKTQENIKEELLKIERNFVKAEKAKDAGTTPDKVEWSEQQENTLNLQDACMVFDEMAENIVEKLGFEKLFRELMQGL